MAGVSYLSLVWEHLQRYGTISHNGIIRLTGCNCPYDVIRKIKDRFGADAVDFRDIPTKKRFMLMAKRLSERAVSDGLFLTESIRGWV